MKENKEVKISFAASHLTTIVSVTLVLLIIGLIAFSGIGASSETRRLKEKLELNVVTVDSTTDVRAAELAERIKTNPWAGNVRVIGKSEALRIWVEQTGENLEELFGVNPLSPEISVTLKNEYASSAQISAIKNYLSRLPDVEGVAQPDAEMVESMNANIEKISWILGSVALALIIISFVLINNTVHLGIYSRRFTIHTMQLVGATDNFIRRPLISSNMFSGTISGLIASGILLGALAGADGTGIEDICSLISWEAAFIVCASLIAIGAVICAVAAWISSTRYLRKDYDRLFK